MNDDVMINLDNIISSSAPGAKRKTEITEEGEIVVTGKVTISVDNLRCTALILDNDIPHTFRIETDKSGNVIFWKAKPNEGFSKFDQEILDQINEDPSCVEFRDGYYKVNTIWTRRKRK